MISDRDYMGNVFGDDDGPPRNHKLYHPILSPKPDAPVSALITSDQVLTCYTHYRDKVTKPCLRHPGCPGCVARMARRWKGFLCVVSKMTGRSCIAELTAGAVESCPALMDRNRSLRGWELSLTRRGRATNAPVTASIRDARSVNGKDHLPPAFDLVASLFHLWGLDGADSDYLRPDNQPGPDDFRVPFMAE